MRRRQHSTLVVSGLAVMLSLAPLGLATAAEPYDPAPPPAAAAATMSTESGAPVPATSPRPESEAAYLHNPAVTDLDGSSFVAKRIESGRVVADPSTAPLSRPAGTGGGTRRKVDQSIKARAGRFPLAAEDAVRPIRFGTAADALVEFGLDQGPVTLKAKTLRPGAPALVGGTVVYRDAGPATDLEYRVAAEGLKEDIVLRSAAAPITHTFHLSDPSGQLGDARPDLDGGVTFTGPQGDLQLRVPGPVAYERNPKQAQKTKRDSPPAPGAALVAPTQGLDVPGVRSADLEVARVRDGFDVTVSVRAQWLKGRKFPVVLDPALVFSGANGQIADATGGVNPDNTLNYRVVPHTDLRVGPQVEQNFLWRSYLKFDTASIPQ